MLPEWMKWVLPFGDALDLVEDALPPKSVDNQFPGKNRATLMPMGNDGGNSRKFSVKGLPVEVYEGQPSEAPGTEMRIRIGGGEDKLKVMQIDTVTLYREGFRITTLDGKHQDVVMLPKNQGDYIDYDIINHGDKNARIKLKVVNGEIPEGRESQHMSVFLGYLQEPGSQPARFTVDMSEAGQDVTVRQSGAASMTLSGLSKEQQEEAKRAYGPPLANGRAVEHSFSGASKVMVEGRIGEVSLEEKAAKPAPQQGRNR